MAPRNARSRCRRGSPSTRRPFRKAGGLRSGSASTSATSSSRDGDIYGDGVNVAARLEGLAEPGGICIARNVYNQVKAKLDLAFEPMGEHRVKNIAEPITVYRVNLDAPGRARRRRPVWTQRAAGRQPQRSSCSWRSAPAGRGAACGGRHRHRTRPARQGAVVAAAEAKPAPPLPDKPSIAVLPFDNISGEERYERLAGGVAAEIGET
jgi:adenylate cyclase